MMLISSKFDLNMVCRTCLSNGEMISLYKRSTTETSLAEMLMSCTSVNYYENDGLATQICLECVSEINRSYKFAMKCKMSDDKLQQYLQNNFTPALALLKKEVDHETDIARRNLKKNKHIENACVPKINKSFENTLATNQIRNDPYDSIPTVKNKNDLKLSDPLNINHIENISTGNMKSELLEVQNQDLKNDMNCDHLIEQSLPIINILPNLDPLEIGISSEFEYKQDNESLTAQSSKLSSERIKREILDGTESEANTWQNNETQELQPINKISIELGKYQSIVSLVDQLSTSSTLPRECIISSIGNAIENNTNSSLKSRELRKSLITNITKVRKTNHNTRSFQRKSPISETTSSFYKLRKRTPRRLPDMEKNIEDSQSDSSNNNNDYQTETSNNLESNNLKNLTEHSTTEAQKDCQNDVSNNEDHLSKQFNNTENYTKCSNSKNVQQCSVGRKSISGTTLNTKLFKCNICETSFGKIQNLKRHMFVHKKKTCSLVPLPYTHTGEKPYSCTVCGRKFVTNAKLEIHTRTHAKEKQFSCVVCNHSFTANSELNVHMSVHFGHDLICSVCGKKCMVYSSLRDHLKIHDEKKHTCMICDMSYKSPRSLYKHKRNQHPTTCSMCNKSFASKRFLKNHLKVHSNEKPFSCLVCNKSYRINRSLKSHMKSHSNEWSHSCTVCNKQFKHKLHLNRHMRTHNDDSAFGCTLCDLTFKLQHHLKVHVERKHPVKD